MNGSAMPRVNRERDGSILVNDSAGGHDFAGCGAKVAPDENGQHRAQMRAQAMFIATNREIKKSPEPILSKSGAS